jgi:rhodanese-related sulfurtransferase
MKNFKTAYATFLLTMTLLLLSCTPGEQSQAQEVGELKNISAGKLSEKLQQQDNDLVLLDTRSSSEYESGHLADARFVNFQTFSLDEVADIPKDAKIVVYCHSGGRSARVGNQLVKAGYQHVENLEGGIVSWKASKLPVVQD